MIRFGLKKSLLLLATVVGQTRFRASRAMARRSAGAGPKQQDSPQRSPRFSNYGAAGRNHNRSFHGDHTRRDPGADGPEEPAAYHVGNSGLRSLP